MCVDCIVCTMCGSSWRTCITTLYQIWIWQKCYLSIEIGIKNIKKKKIFKWKTTEWIHYMNVSTLLNTFFVVVEEPLIL